MISKQNKLLVPELRFTEFSGEWEEKKLGEVSEFYDYKRVPLSKSERIKKKGLFPYYGASGIIDNVDGYLFDGEYILLGEDGANIIDRNSRLAFIAKGKFWVNNHAHVLKAQGSNYFLSESLENINYSKYNTGTAQPKLNSTVCKKIKLNLPSKPEQQRIASFLSSTDNWIKNLERQKESLEEYKKGLMQKIFNQEIRFKDDNGNEYPKWKKKKIGNLFNIKAGGDISKLDFSKTKDSEHQYPVFANTLKRQGLYGYSKKAKINENCVTVTGRGDIGHAVSRKAGFSPVVRLLTLLPISKLSTYFFQEVINSLNIFIESTGVPQLTAPQISIYKVKYPCLEEQNKIASFLFSIDRLIESKANQIKKANEWKKGLLQQMFV